MPARKIKPGRINMRLVRHRREGRQVFYAVDDHHIIELLKQALTHVEE